MQEEEAREEPRAPAVHEHVSEHTVPELQVQELIKPRTRRYPDLAAEQLPCVLQGLDDRSSTGVQ